MKTKIQERRLEAGLTVRELAKGMGPGFSAARLSRLERALIPLTPYEERLILGAIDRLGPICADRRRVVELVRDLDLGTFVREDHCAA